MADSGDNFFVTIYTDASYYRGQGKWAFFAKCRQGKLEMSGHANRRLCSSNSAEMYAICMAIWCCLRKWPGLQGFFINTDSLTCCQIIWPFRKSPQVSQAVKMFEKIERRIGNRWIRAKHVKGHQNMNGCVRAFLNNKVDGMARKAKKKKRKRNG